MLRVLVGTNHRPRTICRQNKRGERPWRSPRCITHRMIADVDIRPQVLSSLTSSVFTHLFYVSGSCYCLTSKSETFASQIIPADCRLKMLRDDEPTSAAVGEAGEKMTASGTREDLECNEEKATSTHVPNGPSYPDQGSDDERALIFKQDLRIIPLCSFIYLLCYLDRSNVGNAKVRPPSQLPNPVEAPHFDAHHRSSTKKKATTS
jgi:hypothetical protein